MASVATAEACDSMASGELRVLHPVFKFYGQNKAFSGPIVTVKVFKDNVLVRVLLEIKGEGRFMVVDGGGSMKCALVGMNLGHLAQNIGWAAIVVNGCIRDVDEINACDIGVRTLASHPMKSNKNGISETHVPVHIGGMGNGEWLYADSDGIFSQNLNFLFDFEQKGLNVSSIFAPVMGTGPKSPILLSICVI